MATLLCETGKNQEKQTKVDTTCMSGVLCNRRPLLPLKTNFGGGCGGRGGLFTS